MSGTALAAQRWQHTAASASVVMLSRLRVVEATPAQREAAWRAAGARFLCACFNGSDSDRIRALARELHRARDARGQP
jgi:hypothetical protein